jgi:hypothetical protein
VHEFFEGRSVIFVVGEHRKSDFLPSWVELFGIIDAFVRTLEFFDLLKQLRFGLDMSEHLLTHEHLKEDQACAPDVAFLIILL